MSRFAALIFCILSLFCVPAAALWTSEEVVELRDWERGLYYSGEALLYLGYSVNACTTPETRPHLATAWQDAVAAHRKWLRGFALLLHANPETDALGTTIDGWTRAQWVAAAWADMDAGFPYKDAARAAMDRALAVPALSAACTDYFRRVKANLDSATARLRGVDRAKAYADPFDGDYPQVIGPHGTRKPVMHLLHRSRHFWLEMLDSARLMYGRTSESYAANGYYAFYRVLLRFVSMERHVNHVWMNVAIVPVDASECSVNKFHLVAGHLGKTLSHTSASQGMEGAPYHINQLVADSHPVLFDEAKSKSPTTQADFKALWQRLSDGWRYMDGAMWMLLEFPDPAKLGQVTGQAVLALPMRDVYGVPACP